MIYKVILYFYLTMIESCIAKKIDTEVDRLRRIYNPVSITSLVDIAKSEYNAKKVVDTSLAFDCSKVLIGKKSYIFYHTAFKPHKPLSLGHEIGHLFLRPGSEEEADYFSIKLNDVSLRKLKLFRLIDASLMIPDFYISLFKRKKEIQRLKDIGAYDAFVAWYMNKKK